MTAGDPAGRRLTAQASAKAGGYLAVAAAAKTKKYGRARAAGGTMDDIFDNEGWG